MLNFESQHDADLFQLSRFLDGDLDTAEADAVRARLVEDAGFARVLGELRSTDQAVRRWAAPAAELDWTAFNREATRRRVQYIAGRRRLRIVRVFAPLAAAAVLVICGTIYFRGGGLGGSNGSPVLAQVDALRVAPWDDPALAGADLLEVRFERTPLNEVSDAEVVPQREAPPAEALASNSRRSSLALVTAGLGTAQDDAGGEASPYF